MRVRYIDRPDITGWAELLNVHSLSEIIVAFDDGDMTSEYLRDLEVLLEHPLESSVYKPNVWIKLKDALKSHDVIVDNNNTWLFEPRTEEDKKRGWAD